MYFIFLLFFACFSESYLILKQNGKTLVHGTVHEVMFVDNEDAKSHDPYVFDGINITTLASLKRPLRKRLLLNYGYSPTEMANGAVYGVVRGALKPRLISGNIFSGLLSTDNNWYHLSNSKAVQNHVVWLKTGSKYVEDEPDKIIFDLEPVSMPTILKNFVYYYPHLKDSDNFTKITTDTPLYFNAKFGVSGVMTEAFGEESRLEFRNEQWCIRNECIHIGDACKEKYEISVSDFIIEKTKFMPLFDRMIFKDFGTSFELVLVNDPISRVAVRRILFDPEHFDPLPENTEFYLDFHTRTLFNTPEPNRYLLEFKRGCFYRGIADLHLCYDTPTASVRVYSTFPVNDRYVYKNESGWFFTDSDKKFQLMVQKGGGLIGYKYLMTVNSDGSTKMEINVGIY